MSTNNGNGSPVETPLEALRAVGGATARGAVVDKASVAIKVLDLDALQDVVNDIDGRLKRCEGLRAAIVEAADALERMDLTPEALAVARTLRVAAVKMQRALADRDDVQPGDVVQISPAADAGIGWARGCYAVVDNADAAEFLRVYVQVPGMRERAGGPAYVRVARADVARIGVAEWVYFAGDGPRAVPPPPEPDVTT